MKNRKGLYAGLGLPLGLCCALLANEPIRDSTVPPAEERTASADDTAPIKLLLITLDTLRADRLGIYGYRRPTTPEIDRLARSATTFLDATCSIPTTLPSHLTLLTGRSPAEHGVTENGQVPEIETTSIFELLAPRGTRSAAVVSAKVLAERFLAELGIEQFSFGDGGAPAAHEVAAAPVTSQAIDWLDRHGSESFALWLHYFDPHMPYEPPDDLAARFTGGYRGVLSAPQNEWLWSLNDERFAATLSVRDRLHVANLYDAEVAALDAELGRLFDHLRANDLWRETLIVLVADHGEALGENDFWGHGKRLLEPVIKVPLLIKLPDQEVARTVRAPVETLDLLPTLAAIWGLDAPAGLSGRSLAETLQTGAAPAPRPPRLIERRSYSRTAPERRGFAVHGGDWKLTFYQEQDGRFLHLGRTHGAGGLDGENLHTPDAPELKLAGRVLASLSRPSSGPGTISGETLEMLRALGYVD